jgi:hypothetical protein
MSNQNTNNSFNNITNENLLLITILNTMYNDNYNQIQNLTQSNNQIRNTLTNILNNLHQRNTNNSNNTNNTRQPNRQSNINRLFLNSPYIIDNIQEYNIPNMFNNTHNILHTANTSSRISDLSNNLLFSFFQNFFDPIEIYPTQTQIESATRRVRYCDIITPVNTSCPISLEIFNDNDMVTVIRQCGHIFKSEQLNTWFRSNCKCPVCRYDIRNYNTNSQGDSYFNNSNLNNDNVNR